MIPAEDLLQFVDNQLDNAMLSQLLQTLSTDFVNNDIPPMNYLLELSKCKALNILALMIEPADRKGKYTERPLESAFLLQSANILLFSIGIDYCVHESSTRYDTEANFQSIHHLNNRQMAKYASFMFDIQYSIK